MLWLNQSKTAASAKRYFAEHLSQGDYYTQEHQIRGQWGGKVAFMLRLSGDVDEKTFASLCDNIHPHTGASLTPYTRTDRRVGYDFTFDVPKSVSVVYERSGDGKILEAHLVAMRETLREMEARAQTRVRKDKAMADRNTGNLLWAEFTHLDARPVDGLPDPHLHTHVFVFNATFDPVEERFKAAQFVDLYRDKGYYQAAYHARLAQCLEGAGYECRPTKNAFELSHVPHSALEKFSRRRDQIEQEAMKRGIDSAAKKHAIGKQTREDKNLNLSREALREAYEARLTQEERAALDAGQPLGKWEKKEASQCVQQAIDHVFERQSTATKREIMTQALKAGVASCTVEEINQAFEKAGLLNKEENGKPFYTTRKALQEERAVIDFANSGLKAARPLAPHHELKNPIFRDAANTEQREAIEHVLKAPDTVIMISGVAGSGKTTLMKETIEAIEENGHKVFTFAKSSEASRGVLRQEGFKNAETVDMLLKDTAKQAAVKGQVVWIDEAGLLSVRETKAIMELAEKQDFRLILSGDSRQHNSVERGDAMRLLQDPKFSELFVPDIKKVQRQKNQDYRQAVTLLRDGNIEEAFNSLERIGGLVDVPDEQERLNKIMESYLESVQAGRSVLVVSPTHAEGEKVSGMVREKLKEAGRVAPDDKPFLSLSALSWTAAEKADAVNYEAGQVVQFFQNAKGISKGERFEVVGHDEAGKVTIQGKRGELALDLDNAAAFQVYEKDVLPLAVGDVVRITQNSQAKTGQRLNNGALYHVKDFRQNGDIVLENGFVLGQDFGHVKHGYCSTSYSSQGKTVNEVIVAQSSLTVGGASLEQFYVSVSRGVHRVKVFTDDLEDLKHAVSQSSQRLSALELMEGTKTKDYFVEKELTPQPSKGIDYGRTTGRTQPERGFGLDY